MQCVEVDPEKRPESMDTVADRLNLILGILRAAQARVRARSPTRRTPALRRAGTRAGIEPNKV